MSGIYQNREMRPITPSVIVARMRGRPAHHPVKTPPNRLREWREARGMSQGALADQCGLHLMTVSRHERGEAPMTISNMQAYARVLKIKPEELLPSQHKMSDSLRELMSIAATLSPDMQAALVGAARGLAAQRTDHTPPRPDEAPLRERKRRA